MHAVALRRCDSYERMRVRDAVSSAVELVGGMAKFVRPGARVLVKPNLLYPRPAESAVTTHPEVVRAVVELAREAGASEVMVGDSPGLAKASTVARACGLTAALEGTGARVVELDQPLEVKGEAFPKLALSEVAIRADAVINVAKAKTHVCTGLTLSTKNCFGFVPGIRKSQWHLRAGRNERMFCRLLVDVARTVGPGLSLVDAVVAMEGNGPGSGTPRPVRAVLAGENAVAVDLAASRLLGFSRAELPVERAARELSAGPSEMKEIEILGDDFRTLAVKDFRRAARHDVRFSTRAPGFVIGLLRRYATPAHSRAQLQLPPGFVIRFLQRYATPQPVIDPRACRLCGQCAEICPPKAMTLSEEIPVVDDKECIRCFCCQEICPSGAISASEGLLARIFAR